MREQMEIEELHQTQQPLWLVNNILFCYEGENTPAIRARESGTSYNTKGNTVVARKPTRTDEKAQKEK